MILRFYGCNRWYSRHWKCPRYQFTFLTIVSHRWPGIPTSMWVPQKTPRTGRTPVRFGVRVCVPEGAQNRKWEILWIHRSKRMYRHTAVESNIHIGVRDLGLRYWNIECWKFSAQTIKCHNTLNSGDIWATLDQSIYYIWRLIQHKWATLHARHVVWIITISICRLDYQLLVIFRRRCLAIFGCWRLDW